jgi:hypothetical protein
MIYYSTLQNTLSYDNAGDVAVNSKVVGLAPGKNTFLSVSLFSSNKPT